MSLAGADRPRHVMVARLDSAGDVLLTGPTVRAVAAGAERVTYLCGSAGRPAAELMPGIDRIEVFDAPWVAFEAPETSRPAIDAFVGRIAGQSIDRALVLTSFHQSPLPLALLLRMAGVPEVAATSVDYPGTLLDVRFPVLDGAHEVEQSLALATALDHRLPPGDTGRLAVRRPLPRSRPFEEPYVVVHPGASVPARGWEAAHAADVVSRLSAAGWRVAVTGGSAERELTAAVAAPYAGDRGRNDRRGEVVDLGGMTSFARLAGVLDGAAVVVCGNTGPAHLAAAVGTPVVSIFAPVVPAERWRPWGVPHVLLGDQDVACAGCHCRVCPLPRQPCLDGVTPELVTEAVAALAGSPVEVVRA